MKWQKVQKHYSYWWIKDYPFFRTNIYYQDYFTKIHTYKKYVYGNNIFDTLQDAMIFVQKKVEIACKEYLKTGNKLHEISISDSVWPNNAGGGKYIREYKKYHWIWGTCLPSSTSYKEYAIRCDAGTDVERIKTKLLNRHCKRFLNEI